MSKQTKRLIVIILIILIFLAYLVFRDQIAEAISTVFRPIGPDGLPTEFLPSDFQT